MSKKILLEEAFKDNKISREALTHILKWLTDPDFEPYWETINNWIQEENWDELENSFFKIIEFGTGGRRGPRGVGPNRINLRTIAESAQGLSDYIFERGDPGKGVVVAFDTRHHSKEYADEVCCVLAGNGIKAYIYSSPRSTPQLSFSIRLLEAQAGCMISASHNPPSDNGIKISWQDGGQVLPPHDKGIIQKVIETTVIRKIGLSEARQAGLLITLDDSIDSAYLENLKSLSLSPARNAIIAYSPLHGVGETNVVKLLKALDFNLVTVDEQMKPDPDFSTVKNQLPNPELPAAMEQVTNLASKAGAAVAIASDPDADRLGATIPCPDFVNPTGWLFLTGNQIGALILDHILRMMKKRRELSSGGWVVKTIVTTELLDAICASYGVSVKKDLLVGFKYIAEFIDSMTPDQHLVFATEESHGYNRGVFVRDKDSAPAALYMAELACELAREGVSIYSHLNNLYRTYGYFCEITKSVYYEGKAGLEIMSGIMQKLRRNPPEKIAGFNVHSIIDRSVNVVLDPATHKIIGAVNQHKGNVLIFNLDETGINRITARPSGTEPKIKFYAQLHQDINQNIGDRDLETIKNRVQAVALTIIDEIASNRS